MGKLDDSLLVHQRLGFVGLSVLLILISTISAISIDAFSPSLPTIANEFGESETQTTLTLTIFFVFYAVGMLVFGTLSDKYGRKPMMLSCLGMYVIGSVLCAISVNLGMLIVLRVVQALGGGGAAAVGTALLKDVFSSKPREKFLMFMSTVQVIGPIAAPLIGACIITFSTWQMVFVVLTVFGAACFVLALFFNETLPKEARITENAFASYKHMGTVLKDKSFTVFLIATLLPNTAFGGFLSTGSFIVMNYFGQSAVIYGIFNAVVAVIGMCGPALYTIATRRVKRRKAIFAMILMPIISGLLLFAFGYINPVLFVIAFIPMALSGAIRPAMTAVLLEQNEEDAGSVSGIVNFANVVPGAVGMAVVPLFSNFIYGIAICAIVTCALSLVFWAWFRKGDMKLKAFEAQEKH